MPFVPFTSGTMSFTAAVETMSFASPVRMLTRKRPSSSGNATPLRGSCPSPQ